MAFFVAKSVSTLNGNGTSRALISKLLGWLALCFAAQISHAADKIIYVRPVPNNGDLVLKQGSNGIREAALNYGLEPITLESENSTAGRRSQLENAIQQNPKYIVLIGFEFGELLIEASKQAPKTQFLWMEHCLDDAPANVYCVLFREEESSYLAGMEAALTSNSGKVGVLGPMDTPTRRKYADAFAAGAKSTKPEIQVQPAQWVGGEQPFDDLARAEQMTQTMMASGVDVIYAIAANSNRGVLRALDQQDKKNAKTNTRMIGHPINQCHMSPGRVLDSVEIHMDVAISLAIGQMLHGAVRPKIELGLKEFAVTLTSISPDAALSECDVVRDKKTTTALKQEKVRIVQAHAPDSK